MLTTLSDWFGDRLGASGRPAIQARRMAGGPIITCRSDPSLGDNVNGPSLIEVPPWIENPLGRYYLYFAHHKGLYIRLAYADRLDGPWQVHAPGTLHLDQTSCRRHIASPDVHVDHDRRQIRMYYHGDVGGDPKQQSQVALSGDGLRFEALPANLGLPYFRVFRLDGWYYALAMSKRESTVIYRSRDGLSPFERGPAPFVPHVRHTAVLLREHNLYVFYSIVKKSPEHIVYSVVDVSGDWMSWRPSRPRTLLKPELDWEGANRPRERSRYGWARVPVRQLRDPGIYEQDGDVYLLYSIAGEQGIAMARLDLE